MLLLPLVTNNRNILQNNIKTCHITTHNLYYKNMTIYYKPSNYPYDTMIIISFKTYSIFIYCIERMI